MTKSKQKKLLAAAILGLLAVTALPHAAEARPDRGWDRHADHARHYWHRPGPEPAVYAPPVVYSPPPPEQSGINLVLPLNFR